MGGGSSKQPQLYDGPGEVTHGPVSGDFTHDSVRLLARGCGDGELHFDISDGWFARYTKKVAVTAAADYTGQLTIHNLVPDTTHRYRVAWTPKGKHPNFNRDGVRGGTFKTAPLPSSRKAFSFQFGSCIGGQGFGRREEIGWKIFETMKGFEPDFMLLLGDSIYADDKIPVEGTMFCKYHSEPGAEEVCTTKAEFHARYRHHLEDPHWASYLASTAVYNTWDDHEIHDDWGGPKLRASKPQLLQDGIAAFFDYWPIERGQAGKGTQVYRSFRYGKYAEFFILDCRQYRSTHSADSEHDTPYMDTMLGEEQKKWLRDGVNNSSATWKFIISSVPVSWPTGWPSPDIDGYDGWSDAGAAAELAYLLATWREAGVTNCIFLSADVHFPWAASYDPFQDGKPLFHEFGSTPLSALCLPPSKPSATLNPTILYAEGAFNGDLRNFAHLTIAEDGLLTFRLLDEKGGEHYSLALEPREPEGPLIHKSPEEIQFTEEYYRALGLDKDGNPLPDDDDDDKNNNTAATGQSEQGQVQQQEQQEDKEEVTPTPAPVDDEADKPTTTTTTNEATPAPQQEEEASQDGKAAQGQEEAKQDGEKDKESDKQTEEGEEKPPPVEVENEKATRTPSKKKKKKLPATPKDDDDDQ
eukprot:TRINITY_DN490_c0_g5_i1.p1 TRINITY_DN490_c0_g5~~TRINITY_DN490_c0_g5_i1.p1  ORF type:complete len:639 (-),score=175.58 TRINITY_DN490_c0_g5_i1:190-2106(-)